jgi:hypothetical protein
VSKVKIRMSEKIPVAPIREAVLDYIEKHDVAFSEIAYRAGFYNLRKSSPRTGHLAGESTSFKRALGIIPHTKAKQPTDVIDPETAAAILRAIHIDPIDLGL